MHARGAGLDTAIRFERRFDVERLRRDLVVAEREGIGHLRPGRYHDGEWTAVPLVSVNGDVGYSAIKWAGPGARVTYAKTPLLARCPYFNEIVDSFQCEKQRVRLMRLGPGSRIHNHSDGPYWSWEFADIARFHIPIITHEDVHFFVNGEELRMQPGELWYCDFSRVHRVVNESPIARVHLVMDFTMNRWLRSLFPVESLSDHARNWTYRLYYRSGAAQARAWMDRRGRGPRVVQD